MCADYLSAVIAVPTRLTVLFIVAVVLFVNPHAVSFCDSCARVSFYTYYICLIVPYHRRFLVNLVCSVTNWCRGQNYILYFTPRSVFL